MRANERLATNGQPPPPIDFETVRCASCRALNGTCKACQEGHARPVPMPVPKGAHGHRTDFNAPTFDFRPWTEFAKEVGEEVQYVVDDLMPESGMSILGSPPKAGKSTLARCACAAVTGASDEVLGRSVTERGNALYFHMEGPAAVAFEHMKEIDPDGKVNFVLQGPDLPEPGARVAAMEQAIIALEPRIVIVDTLAKFVSGVPDINDYNTVSAALAPYDAMLSRHKCHVCWLHHTGKSQAGVPRRARRRTDWINRIGGCRGYAPDREVAWMASNGRSTP